MEVQGRCIQCGVQHYLTKEILLSDLKHNNVTVYGTEVPIY